MMRKILWGLCGLALLLIVFLWGHSVGYNKRQPLLNAYDSYYQNCEILLDSIADRDSTFKHFMDTTKVYEQYLKSREPLWKLVYVGPFCNEE